MDDRDLIAGSYANAATLADTVLILIDGLRAEAVSKPNQAQKRSLVSLHNLLRGTANGAESLVTSSDLSPAGERSLSDDLALYDIVNAVKGELEPKELKKWTKRTATVVKRLQSKSYPELGDEDRGWISVELEPFLEELAQIDGQSMYEDELEIRQQKTTAA